MARPPLRDLRDEAFAQAAAVERRHTGGLQSDQPDVLTFGSSGKRRRTTVRGQEFRRGGLQFLRRTSRIGKFFRQGLRLLCPSGRFAFRFEAIDGNHQRCRLESGTVRDLTSSYSSAECQALCVASHQLPGRTCTPSCSNCTSSMATMLALASRSGNAWNSDTQHL